MSSALTALTQLKNPSLSKWIQEVAELCTPDNIHICDGSEQEYQQLCAQMVANQTIIPLNEQKRPNSFLARSNPQDVARVEDRTFICTTNKDDAGPTNHWCDPIEMKERLHKLFKGCMQGRTLYVIPFSMGPLHSPMSKIGIQITDSPYAVCNMRIMTRMGKKILDVLGEEGSFVPCLHSIGVPLSAGQKDVAWPCNAEKYIVHFPEDPSVWSFGSGYGGNALLGKKCFALRIASAMARNEGWLAEHMLILGITNPEGVKKYFAAAFPSACGKTNLAMMTPTIPGWKVETVGDDIAWMKFDEEGKLRAVNPEFGFFGVAPGTSISSNPNAMRSIEENTIFTNVALTDEGDVWWEGMTPTPPKHLIDWLGKDWDASRQEKAAHPNARFTAPASQCPVIDSAWQDPKGVHIEAILFGGRRSNVVPLVSEAFDWQHGVFMGVGVSSETTAAATGQTGRLRHDPFAMLPFCGYNMGDYFAHWLSVGKENHKQLPRIYYVNWFRKDDEGKWLWPGYGENSRVLKWIFERLQGTAKAKETPIGFVPEKIDVSGLKISSDAVAQLFEIKTQEWMKEAEEMKDYLSLFGERLPKQILNELEKLKQRLKKNNN